tara:strand:+ start:474 stop:668 length:195 start_codon:yes stop_codon:yes gene_type:complete
MDKVTKWKNQIKQLEEKQAMQNEHVNKFLKATGDAISYEQLGNFLTQTLDKLHESELTKLNKNK